MGRVRRDACKSLLGILVRGIGHLGEYALVSPVRNKMFCTLVITQRCNFLLCYFLQFSRSIIESFL